MFSLTYTTIERISFCISFTLFDDINGVASIIFWFSTTERLSHSFEINPFTSIISTWQTTTRSFSVSQSKFDIFSKEVSFIARYGQNGSSFPSFFVYESNVMSCTRSFMTELSRNTSNGVPFSSFSLSQWFVTWTIASKIFLFWCRKKFAFFVRLIKQFTRTTTIISLFAILSISFTIFILASVIRFT